MLTTGCSTMSIQECRGTDWFETGYADAATGHGTQRFLEYHNNCGQHGIPPNRTRYLAGWTEGRQSSPKI